ncbi:MAG: hypothetical protein RIC80_00800 [Cyclobacteriaceae bacterium]
MDDFQTILYIVVGIIYFLSRALKKKKPPVKPSRPGQDTEDDTPQTTASKPLTFEELLREFTEGKQPEEEEQRSPIPPPTPEPARRSTSPMTYRQEEDDDEILEPAKRRFSDEDSKRIYEASIRSVEKMKEEEFEDTQYHFKQYEDHRDEETTLGAEVADMLRDADGARKAIILSEILTRKY